MVDCRPPVLCTDVGSESPQGDTHLLDLQVINKLSFEKEEGHFILKQYHYRIVVIAYI